MKTSRQKYEEHLIRNEFIRRNLDDEARHTAKVIPIVFFGSLFMLCSCIIPALLIMSAKGITLQEFLRYF